MNRRHLSREQKRELIAESLRSDPILRDREHARRCGANHETVGRVRADEGIPTPDEVIRAYVADNPGKSWREYGADLGVEHRTVKAAVDGGENGENRQNPHPDPEPEPPAPSWEPAGQLHPADLAALNNEVKAATERGENGENRQNRHPAPESPAPSWEPAGHLHTNAPQAP